MDLNDNAKKVVEYFFLNIRKNSYDAARYNLGINTDLPYYVYCYWDSGSNGSFASEEDVITSIIDSKNRSYDEAYDVRILRVSDCKEIHWQHDGQYSLIED